MKRVIYYFDGFNFYNGLKMKAEKDPSWKAFYWLDFYKFCSSFLYSEIHELVTVKYFTAPPANKEKRSKQAALFSANEAINPGRFKVFNGNYQHKEITCLKCNKTYTVPEEKRTDVNIAVNMMMDCHMDLVDTLVLVSADSDQIPTLQGIKKEFPHKTVKVYFPPERNSGEIFNLAKPILYLNDHEDRFRKSILPNVVKGLKTNYSRPEDWK